MEKRDIDFEGKLRALLMTTVDEHVASRIADRLMRELHLDRDASPPRSGDRVRSGFAPLILPAGVPPSELRALVAGVIDHTKLGIGTLDPCGWSRIQHTIAHRIPGFGSRLSAGCCDVASSASWVLRSNEAQWRRSRGADPELREAHLSGLRGPRPALARGGRRGSRR